MVISITSNSSSPRDQLRDAMAAEVDHPMLLETMIDGEFTGVDLAPIEYLNGSRVARWIAGGEYGTILPKAEAVIGLNALPVGIERGSLVDVA